MPGANFREGLQNGARQAFCSLSQDVVAFTGWLYDRTHPLWLPDRDSPYFPPPVGAGLAGLICGDLPPEPPVFIPPSEFEGGQCQDVRYRARITYTVESTTGGAPIGPFTANYDMWGPVVSVRTYEQTYGQTNVSTGFLIAANGVINNSNQFGADRAADQGFSPTLGGDSAPVGATVATTFSVYNGSESNKRFPVVSNLEVVRVDGAPDECGSPPPPPPPPLPPGAVTFDIDIDYDNSSGNNITIPVGFAFAYPTVNIDGSLTIPVDMSGANFNLSGNLDVNTGDLNFNFDGGAPGNEACCQPPDIENPPEEEVDPPEEPEEEESVIIGVVVTSVVDNSAARTTRVFQEDATTIYHPRLGNIYFRIKIGNSTVWTEDIPVRVRQQYISCPVDFGAVAVVGVEAPGVTWTLSPIRRRIVETKFPE